MKIRVCFYLFLALPTIGSAKPIGEIIFDKFSAVTPEIVVKNGMAHIPSQLRGVVANCFSPEVQVKKNKYKISSVRAYLSCSDGKQYSFYSDITGLVDVAVLRRDVFRGEPVTSDQFTIEPRPLEFLNNGFITDTKLTKNFEYLRNLSSGRVLYDKDFRLVYDVNFNEPTMVKVRVGAVEVSTEVIPLSSGYVGEKIKVKNPNSGNVFTAVVDSYKSLKALK